MSEQRRFDPNRWNSLAEDLGLDPTSGGQPVPAPPPRSRREPETSRGAEKESPAPPEEPTRRAADAPERGRGRRRRSSPPEEAAERPAAPPPELATDHPAEAGEPLE